jgi:hypothetical protein
MDAHGVAAAESAAMPLDLTGVELEQAQPTAKASARPFAVLPRIADAYFMRYDSGFFDHETCLIESAENPFAAKVLPMSPV